MKRKDYLNDVRSKDYNTFLNIVSDTFKAMPNLFFKYYDTIINIYLNNDKKTATITFKLSGEKSTVKAVVIEYNSKEWDNVKKSINFNIKNKKLNPSLKKMEELFFDDVITSLGVVT